MEQMVGVVSESKGLRLHATFNLYTSSLSPTLSIPLPFGPQGAVDVFALPSGLRVEAGQWRLIWRGAGLPAYLLGLEARTHRTLPEGLPLTREAIAPVSQVEYVPQGEEAMWSGTIETSEGLVFFRVRAVRAPEVDPYAAYLAAALFVPGVRQFPDKYIPIHLEFDAWGARVAEVDITFETAPDDPALVEVPPDFEAEPPQVWTSDQPSTAQPTTENPTTDGPTSATPSNGTNPDPDAVEIIRPSFLDALSQSINKLAAAFREPVRTAGLRFAWPWYREFKDFLRKLSQDATVSEGERKAAESWLKPEGFLAFVLSNWAAQRLSRLWQADTDRAQMQWLAPLFTERPDPIRPIDGQSAFDVAKSVVVRNEPKAEWSLVQWRTLVNEIAAAVQAGNPDLVAEGWFIGAPPRPDLESEFTGTLPIDLAERLRQSGVRATTGASPERDTIFLPDAAGLDVTISAMETSLKLASPLMDAALSTQPDGIILGLQLDEVRIQFAFAARPRPTIINVILFYLTGGLSPALQNSSGTVNMRAQGTHLSLFLTSSLQADRIGWTVTPSFRAGAIRSTVVGTPLISVALLSVLTQFVTQSMFLDAWLSPLSHRLGEALARPLASFAFPRTLRLFGSARTVQDQRQVSLADVFGGNFGSDVLLVCLRRYASVQSEAEISINDLPTLVFSGPEVQLCYVISRYLLRNWVESIWWAHTPTGVIDWATGLGIAIPAPSPDPPPVEEPPEEEEPPPAGVDDVEIEDRGVVGSAAPRFRNAINVGRAMATLRSVTAPGAAESIGTARVPLTLQVGWTHYKLVRHSWTFVRREATGETDARGKPILKVIMHIVREWRPEFAYFETFLELQGYIELNMFLGLDVQEPIAWPTLRLVFKPPAPAEFVADRIQRNPPFTSVSEERIRDFAKTTVMETLRTWLDQFGSDGFFAADQWFDRAGLAGPGITLHSLGGSTLMVISDNANDMNIGLRFVSPLLGLPM